jgi:hypothetical protein
LHRVEDLTSISAQPWPSRCSTSARISTPPCANAPFVNGRHARVGHHPRGLRNGLGTVEVIPVNAMAAGITASRQPAHLVAGAKNRLGDQVGRRRQIGRMRLIPELQETLAP